MRECLAVDFTDVICLTPENEVNSIRCNLGDRK